MIVGMYADIEQAIIDRLRLRLPDGTHVGAERELNRLPDLRQKAPAVWVIYDGFTPTDHVHPTGLVQQVSMEWFVVIAARSARNRGGVDDARDEADALCGKVLAALLGFHLGGGRYLKLGPAPGPVYDAGYCHVPLGFTCSATFKGEPV